MNTYPSKKQYYEWSNKYSRVPILGEKCILKFNAPLLFSKLFSKDSEAFLFESGKGSSDISRYSYMGESNQSYVEIREKYSTIKLNNTFKKFTGTVDDGWDALNFKKNIPCFKYLPHFWGGWIGYIGYEAVNLFENLPRRKANDLELPDAYFIQVDRVIVYDNISNQLKYIIASESRGNNATYDQYIEEIGSMWNIIDSILSKSSNKIKLKAITFAYMQ